MIGAGCWSKEVSAVLQLLDFLVDSQDESLASNLYGRVGALTPKLADWNMLQFAFYAVSRVTQRSLCLAPALL